MDQVLDDTEIIDNFAMKLEFSYDNGIIVT